MFSIERPARIALAATAVFILGGCGGGDGQFGVPQPVLPEKINVAWTADNGLGRLRAMSTESPWQFSGPQLTIGGDATLRCGNGDLFVLSRTEGTVSRIDLPIEQIELIASLGAGEPIDMAVTGPDTAYVTRKTATHLLRLDIDTGATTDVADLSLFADEDGIPDLGTLAVHNRRLFVQIRRMTGGDPASFVPPAYIAVIDLETEQVIDTEPEIPGIQAIELLGTAPNHKMQVIPHSAELFVSATGVLHDQGGIEVINLNTLRSKGLVVSEAFDDVGAGVGPFVMVDANEGFLVTSTDLIGSSHLHRFTVDGGVDPPPDLAQSVDYHAPAIVLDSKKKTLYFPSGDPGDKGIEVIDVASGESLTPALTKTDGNPSDLIPQCSLS